MYNIIKIFFYIWLFHPTKRGAAVIYENLLRPVLKKYEEEIDSKLEKLVKVVESATPKFESIVQDARKEVTHRAVEQAISSPKSS